jgi:Fe-Mn family superoxide dismutase
MPHTLPPLPYEYGALAPTIDELTLRIHHAKHHGAYVAGLNAAVAGTRWAEVPADVLLTDLDRLPDDVRENAGGHANHTLFWEVMAPDGGGDPRGPLREALEGAFDSVAELKRQMTDAALARPGSGWVWLVHDGDGLAVTSTRCQGSPLSDGHTPLLGIDVWEHAYYLKYQHRRADYLEAWWNVISWERVAERHATVAARDGEGGA